MRDNHNTTTSSARKASSFIRYAIRAQKDACLHDDVEYFLFMHGDNIPRLVDKLLDNDFVLSRYTDPTYPI
jgi:hypothetical protein